MWDTEILLARHGETDWNRTGRWQGSSDIPLNSRGEIQAATLAKTLKGESIRYIYSSDLSRARRTADIVARALGTLKVFQDTRLRERHLGRFEGWSNSQVARYMEIPEEDAHTLDFDELVIDRLPTVEKWNDFTGRVWDALASVQERCMGSRCLVVAHGGVLRAVAMKMGFGPGESINFDNTQVIRLGSSNSEWSISFE